MANLKIKKRIKFIILNKNKLVTLRKFKEYCTKKKYKM